MRRTAAVVVGALWAALGTFPVRGAAAEVTRVASSFEDKHPFGVFVDAVYQRTQHTGVIAREVTTAGSRAEVPELDYLGVDSRLDLGLHIGIWRGLEVSAELPVVFSQTDAYAFTAGRDASSSAFTQNCVSATGALLDPSCLATGAGAQAIGTVPSINFRGGLGNLKLGFAYAILEQRLDFSKPTWTIFFKYEAPTAARYDPAMDTTPEQRTGVGDKVHRYTFGTAFSRKSGVAEPYFKLDYTLPFRGPGYYSNCDRTDLGNLAAPENCSGGAWSRTDTAINPPHLVSLAFGTEIVPLDRVDRGQRVAIDVRGIASYSTAGRYYNEVTPLFRKLMSSDGFLDVGASVGFTGQPAGWLTFRLRASYSYQTDRTVTAETIGKDLDGDGRVTFLGSSTPEVNPTFDHRADLIGRRFRMINNGVFSFSASLSLNF